MSCIDHKAINDLEYLSHCGIELGEKSRAPVRADKYIFFSQFEKRQQTMSRGEVEKKKPSAGGG